MAKTHSSLTGADLHDNKGIGVETTANFMTISQSTNILSASAASTASFGRFEGSGDSHFSGSVSFGGNMTFGDSASDSVSITADLTSHLIPNADATYDLGSTSQGWNDLHLGSGGVINLDGGDVTMTHSANLVSIAGGNTRVIRLEIDSASDYIDVDTDLKIIAAADVVVDPAGGELKVDGNVVPNSDSADSLGASGTAWANLYVDDIDLNGQGSISMGGTGRIDLDADDDTSIRASADDVITFEAGGADEMSLSATSLYPATDDGLALGSASQNWSDLFIADEGVINFGDDQDVSLTHVLDTGLLLSSSDKLQFGDSGTFIHQSGDGVLTIESDTTVDINGAVAFDGNVSGVGTLGCGAITSTGNLAVTGTITGDTSLTLDSTTWTTAELGVLDGVTAGTAAASKALVLDASKDIGTIRNLTIDGTLSDGNYTFDTSGNVTGLGTVGCGAITSTGNLAVTGTITGDTSLTLDTTTLTTAELGVLDSVTAGTAAASKALVLDASKDIATIRNLTIDGTFSDGNYTFDTSGNVSGLGTVGCGAITSTGNSSFAGGVTVGGDFTVNGTTVTVDATTLNVADKNITIASGSTTSANMNGAGLNFGLDAAVAQLAYRHSDTTLTSSVDLGAPQFHSSIATGTAPLTVQSTTVVANLNAATVAGKTMAEPGAIGGTTAGAITGTTIDATTDFTIDGLVLTADTITNDAALSVVSTGLTLDASLDIALSADGGNVTMDDGTTTAFDFNVDDVELKIHDDAQVANYASIAVGDNGATTITTVDADAAAANLQITADGTAELAGTTVTLDSGANVVLSPAAGSHVKIDDVIQVDSGVLTGATSITSTALSATSASITYISASKVEVDATSLTIGGTSLNKTVADNISAIDQTVNTTSSPQFAKVNIDSSSDYLDVDTDFKMVAAADITLDPAGGNVKPASNDDAALGVAGTGWSDLFLAEGAVINWDSGDLMLTQAGDVLTLGGDGSPTLTATLTNALSITAAGGIGMTSYDASAAVTDLALDIDGMTDIGADLASGDIFAVDDGAGGTNRKVTIDRIADFVSGSAFSKVSGDISITGAGVATVTGAETNAALTAGTGISAGGTFNGATARTFALDLSELSDVQIASGDKLAVLDSDNSTEQLESIDDIATLFAGTGLTAASAVIGVDAAQTGITSIYATDLIMGEDSQTAIDFGDDNNIEFKTNNAVDFKMVAGGTFHANSDVVAYSSTVASDMNLKENITDTKYGLDDIMKLRGVEYDWKREDMGHDVGVLAQEVEAVIPELVKEVDGLNGREGFKAVDYNKLVPVLIESIKELKSEIDELKLIKN